MSKHISFRFLALLAALLAFAWMTPLLHAADASPIQVQINAAKAGPRDVEESTQAAIVRDYGRAWQGLAAALDGNRADLLDYGFTGFARDAALSAIRDQKTTGLRTRYLDHGHRLEAVFYSQEGSALELRDVAQMEIQLLDGTTVVHSEQATVRYIVLMTPAADHWQVRNLQAVPEF